MEVMRVREDDRRLDGRVEIDDAYLGGNLKRSLSGTYHACDFAKYAHRYLAKAQYRFNRRFNLRSILASLLRAACHSTPAPANVIRVAEASR